MRRIKQLLHSVEDLDACIDHRQAFEIPDVGIPGLSTAVIDPPAQRR
jgi:hypothetical protein